MLHWFQMKPTKEKVLISTSLCTHSKTGSAQYTHNHLNVMILWGICRAHNHFQNANIECIGIDINNGCCNEHVGEYHNNTSNMQKLELICKKNSMRLSWYHFQFLWKHACYNGPWPTLCILIFSLISYPMSWTEWAQLQLLVRISIWLSLFASWLRSFF